MAGSHFVPPVGTRGPENRGKGAAQVKAIDVRIQGSWLHRRGLRGRWVTVYVHRYGGQESTERLHSHPWVLGLRSSAQGQIAGGRRRGDKFSPEARPPIGRDLPAGDAAPNRGRRCTDGVRRPPEDPGTNRKGGGGSYCRGVLPLHGDPAGRAGVQAGLRGGRRHGTGIHRRLGEHRIAVTRNRIELFNFHITFHNRRRNYEW